MERLNDQDKRQNWYVCKLCPNEVSGNTGGSTAENRMCQDLDTWGGCGYFHLNYPDLFRDME